jgi:hypothetical protein
VIRVAIGNEEGFGEAPPVDGVLVDELRAVVTVELADGERTGGINVLEALQGPAEGLVEESREPYPA